MRSRQVADLAGISYRQLDYLTRTVDALSDGTMSRGSGTRRLWTPDQLARITIAALLTDAAGQANLPAMANAVFTVNARPPRAGWAWCSHDPVDAGYSADIRDLVEHLEQAGAGVVVSYNLEDLYGPAAHVLNDLVAA
jgi:hypothetical protein